MNDRDALLAAILSNPEEDTPRLMFADWLQENGQDRRAHFIRQQVEAAQAEPFSRAARTAAEAADRFLEGFRGEWTRTVRQWLLGWELTRGFIEHASVNVLTFPRDADLLFAAEPIRSLQPVRFASIGPPPLLDEFLQTPQLERITRLNLSSLDLSPAELEPVSTCPLLQNLTHLHLRGCPIPVDWPGRCLTGDTFPLLTSLDLSDITNLGPRLADALPFAAHRRFRRLDLSGIPFTSDHMKRVLQCDCLREVEELRLGWMTGSGREGALTHLDLGWVIPWDRLRLLDLNGQGVGDGGVDEIVKELKRRPVESPLRWLGLANNNIQIDGVRALLRSPESKLRLYHLDLRGNRLALSPADRTALQARFPDAVIEI